MSNNNSSRLPGEAGTPDKDSSADYSDLSPELIGIVRALQASLAEKRVRQQLQSVESEQPSKLESAFTAQQAKRAGKPEVTSHPQLLAALVESADAGILSETWNGVLLTWNRGAERIFGYGAAEMIGNTRAVLIPEFLKNDDAKVMNQVVESKAILSRETVWQHKDGKFVDVAVSFAPIIENDKVVRLTVVVSDITERKRMERALMESERKQRHRAAELKIVLDAVPAAVCIAHDPECKSITGNRMAYDLLRLPQGSNLAVSEIDGAAPTFRMFRNGRVLEAHELPVQMAAFRGIEVRDFEQDIVFDDGSIRHLVGNAAPLRDASGKVYGAVAAFIDITTRRNMEEQIRRMAHFDSLTSLPNRILLMDRLEQALAISQRNHSKTSVIFMDLDHFKEINDSLGHHVGDMLLQQVAERIRGALREVDTVSRLGGDEFVMVLPELRHTEDATTIAQKLLHALDEDFFISGDKLRISPSMGISIYPDHAADASTLIRIADKAMYHAKQAGRNTYRFYDEAMKA